MCNSVCVSKLLCVKASVCKSALCKSVSFLDIHPHFVRKGCDWTHEIAILPQFLAIAFHCVSLALPRAVKREIEKKEAARGQESKRARDQEGKSRENVKM